VTSDASLQTMMQQTTTLVADTVVPMDTKSKKNAYTKAQIKFFQRQNLFNLIDRTSEYRLRQVMKEIICKNGRTASDWVMAELLVCESEVKPWEEGDDDLGSDWEEEEEREREEEEEREREAEEEEREREEEEEEREREEEEEREREEEEEREREEEEEREREELEELGMEKLEELGRERLKELQAKLEAKASQTNSNAETNAALPTLDATQAPVSTVVLEPPTMNAQSKVEANAALPTLNATQSPVSTVVLELPTTNAQIHKVHKRMRPRYAKCVNCKEEFDVSCNEKGDCRYHPGKLLA
jgi:hypothetical protein